MLKRDRLTEPSKHIRKNIKRKKTANLFIFAFVQLNISKIFPAIKRKRKYIAINIWKTYSYVFDVTK